MKGREPVIGLTAADFAITDNGVRQTVDSIVSDQVAIDVTLVLTGRALDRASEHEGSLVTAERMRKLLNPADRLRMVWITDEVAGSVVDADYRVTSDITTRDLINGIASPTGVTFEEPSIRSGFGIALADGLFYALAWPVEPDRRHLVVVFTDGWDTTSTLNMDTLQKLAAHSDAVLHAVFWAAPGEDTRNAGGLNIVGGPIGYVGRWRRSFDTLIDSVHQSGGTIHRTGNAPDALADILADVRSSYTLRYSPRGVALGGWHELEVEATEPTPPLDSQVERR
jgi:hypothetical protein